MCVCVRACVCKYEKTQGLQRIIKKKNTGYLLNLGSFQTKLLSVSTVGGVMVIKPWNIFMNTVNKMYLNHGMKINQLSELTFSFVMAYQPL